MSGFDEAAYDCWHCKAKAKYILSLTGRGLELSKRIAELEGDNARLRDSLKRLEWWNEKPGTGQDGRTNIYHRLFNLAKVAKRWQLLQPRKWSMTLGAVGLCPYCRRRIYTPFIDHFDRCQEFARALVSGERQ
jgi:hypothetical protein